MTPFRRRFKQAYRDLDPDEVLLDARNLPSFNTQQFEGRLEKPISKLSFYFLAALFALVLVIFLGKVFQLQVVQGGALAERSHNNTLRHIPIFAERGIIEDRHGEELAWNDAELGRAYNEAPGLAHLVGYIGYPNEEEMATGNFHPKQMVGREGAERWFNEELEGGRGLKIEEVDVGGEVVSEHVLEVPKSGAPVRLSIDLGVQGELGRAIESMMSEYGFRGGAGLIMDVKTGQLLAMVSAPEYRSGILSQGEDRAAINGYLTDKRLPFLNRVLRGLYTPGSIVKTIMAAAALQEGVISPTKQIYSSGEIAIANPYSPKDKSIFRDWKAHGWVDVRRALAVSSNVYFYAVGGGYEDQRGIGIRAIDRYAQAFGLGEATGFRFGSEETGNIPTPEWKEKVFDGEPWRLGDTYHTVIGQYGFQVTPLQMVRVVGALATGSLVRPTISTTDQPVSTPLGAVSPENLQIVREGMRQAVLEGTAKGLMVNEVAIAGKTGTAELGVSKADVNSWTMGFWPYENPRFAYAVVLEQGSRNNLVGATLAMRQVINWLVANRPEYLLAETR